MIAKRIWQCVIICFIWEVYANPPTDKKAIEELKTEIKVEMILAAGPDRLNYTLSLLCKLAQKKESFSYITSLPQPFTDLDAEKILRQNNVNPTAWTSKVKYLQTLTQKENPFQE